MGQRVTFKLYKGYDTGVIMEWYWMVLDGSGMIQRYHASMARPHPACCPAAGVQEGFIIIVVYTNHKLWQTLKAMKETGFHAGHTHCVWLYSLIMAATSRGIGSQRKAVAGRTDAELILGWP